VSASAVLEVRGMRCGGCERSVAAAVLALPGVEAAAADQLAEELEVTYDPAVAELEAIRAAIASAGFAPGALVASSR
jgi:copper chaperone